MSYLKKIHDLPERELVSMKWENRYIALSGEPDIC